MRTYLSELVAFPTTGLDGNQQMNIDQHFSILYIYDKCNTIFVHSNSIMPSYMILGGCGFIGRTIVEHIQKEELAAKVRVVDKRSAEMANMLETQEEMFNDESFVEFK